MTDTSDDDVTSAEVQGGAALRAHHIAVGDAIEVTLPGAGLSGVQILAGSVSEHSTHAVLVLNRGGNGVMPAIVDRIPWSAIWVIRTKPEAGS